MKCKYKESCGYDFCMDDCCPEFEAAVETNADRIRAMSDEELADMFARFEFSIAKEVCAEFGVDLTAVEHDFGASAKEELEWLKQPAEGE